MMHIPALGDLILEKCLGEGSFGAVYNAREKEGWLVCAIKQSLRQVPTALAKFVEECRVLADIKHPNIVSSLGIHTNSEGMPLLIMELMDKNLTQYLEACQDSLPMHDQIDICLQIGYALAHLHTQNILHRDLNSNNVLMKGSIVKVADFGVFKLLGDGSPTAYSPKLGIDQYMPPEAYSPHPVYTDKFDVFSLGVLIIQVITRERPNPTNRHISITAEILQAVSENVRRKEQISKVADDHPMRALALQCLADATDKRPSAKEVVSTLNLCQVQKQYCVSAQKGQEKKATVEAQLRQERDSAQKGKQKWQSEANELKKLKQEYQQQVAASKGLEQKLQQETAALKAKEEQLQKQIHKHKRKSKESQEAYKRKLNDFSSQCSRWKFRATGLEAQNAQLQAQLKDVTGRLAQVQQQLQSKEQEQQQMTALKVREQQFQEELDKLQRVSKEKEQQLQEKLNKIQKSASTKEQELRLQEQERAFKQKEADYENRLKSLHGECSTLKSNAATLEQQLKVKNEQLQSVVTYCSRQLQQVHVQKAQEVQQITVVAKTKQSQLEKEIHKLQESAAAKEQEVRQLRLQKQAFQAKDVTYQQKLSSLTQDISSMHLKIASLEHKLQLTQEQGHVHKATQGEQDQLSTAIQQVSSKETRPLQTNMKKEDKIGHQSHKSTEVPISTGTVSVFETAHSQLVTWERRGFQIHIPVGAQQGQITMSMYLGGNFYFPTDTELVSAVFKIKASMELRVPVTLEIEHGCDLTSANSSKLVFARSTSQSPPYKFEILKEGKFPPESSYGRIEVSHFSWYTILQRFGVGDSRQYRGHVFYHRVGLRHWKVVLVVTRKLEQFLEVRNCTIFR